MTKMSNSDFHRMSTLLEASLTGHLTKSERQEFEKALGESEELRLAYLQAMNLHLDLDRLSRSDEDLLVARANGVAHAGSVSRLVKKWSAPLLLSTLAVCLMIATFCFSLFVAMPEQPAGPVAVAPEVPAEDTSPVIVEVANAAIFGEGRTPEQGQRLILGRRYILTEGYLAIRFHSGARAVVQAPGVFSAVGAERFLVRSGKCSVYAPPGAEGFELLSPSAEIVDLGTRFVVDVAETGETQLSVIEGEATMAALGDAATMPLIHLFDGDMAQVDPGLPPRRVQASPSQLTYMERLPDRVISYEATIVDSLAEELLSVTVQRDGVTRTFEREDMVRGRVGEFTGQAGAATFCTRMDDDLPEGAARLDLLHGDFSLVTGIINPSASDSQEVCMSIEFEEPIVNSPGPDIIVFDLQLLVYAPKGDKLTLRSGDDRASRPELVVEQFDIQLNSPYALDLLPHKTYRSLERTTSVDDLIQKQFMHGRQVNVDARALAVGIDLSDLGYQNGESLKILDFLPATEGVDPVLIIGLRPAERPTP